MNTEDEDMKKDLLDFTNSLTNLYDKLVKEERIATFKKENPEYKDVPDEWVEALLKDYTTEWLKNFLYLKDKE